MAPGPVTGASPAAERAGCSYWHDAHAPCAIGRRHTHAIRRRQLDAQHVRPRGMSVRCLRLFRYLDERMFTFDELELGEYRRVELVLRAVAGRWLTFTEVTGHA
jgi:hypothetical protein